MFKNIGYSYVSLGILKIRKIQFLSYRIIQKQVIRTVKNEYLPRNSFEYKENEILFYNNIVKNQLSTKQCSFHASLEGGKAVPSQEKFEQY